MALIIVGIIMIGFQFISVMGNINMGRFDFFTNVTSLSVFIYELIRFCSYNLIGIIGIILVIIGAAEYNAKLKKAEEKTTTQHSEQPKEIATEKSVNRERNQKLIRDYVNDTARTEPPKSTGQNYTENRKRYRTLATKTVAASVSVGLCIVLFLVFLFSVFTTEIETYICYTTNTGECYHAEYCQYLYRSSHRTTVYKASREYRPCSKCDPCQEEYKTTITERNFPGAVFASLPIPIILYFVLTRIKYEEDVYI